MPIVPQSLLGPAQTSAEEEAVIVSSLTTRRAESDTMSDAPDVIDTGPLRVEREHAQYVRDGHEVMVSSLVTAMLIAAMTGRTFQVDRDACAGALTDTGEPLNQPPVTAYVFNQR